MQKIILGIPTYHRHDLCRRCIDSALAGTLPPHLIYVIDNWGNFAHPPARVINPPENLGVARSWNLLYKLTKPTPLILANDDIIFGPQAIERAANCAHDLVALDGWSCFLQRPAVWEAVGEYDEGFWPAYYEDSDYRQRMIQAGLQWFDLRGLVEHDGSATIKSLSSQQRCWLDSCIEKNRARYLAKWGALPS